MLLFISLFLLFSSWFFPSFFYLFSLPLPSSFLLIYWFSSFLIFLFLMPHLFFFFQLNFSFFLIFFHLRFIPFCYSFFSWFISFLSLPSSSHLRIFPLTLFLPCLLLPSRLHSFSLILSFFPSFLPFTPYIYFSYLLFPWFHLICVSLFLLFFHISLVPQFSSSISAFHFHR